MVTISTMPRPASGRDRNLRVNVSDEELEMLRALADLDGLTVSDVLRSLARRAYRERIGDKAPGRAKRSR
jgi:hypothetical protein